LRLRQFPSNVLRFIAVTCFIATLAEAQGGHPAPAPPPPGAKSANFSGRTVPQFEDITLQAGITFKHTSDPAA
jgi:hypothetical protein